MSYYTFDRLEDASVLFHGVKLPLVSAYALKPSCTNSHLSTRQFRCNCVS